MTTLVDQGDTNFGYLPLKTLGLAFAAALFFRVIGVGSEFLASNASWPNVAMAIMMTSVLLVIYFFTSVHPYDDSALLQGARKVLVEYIKFSFELGFFAVGFIMVVEFGDPGYWISLAFWFPAYLLIFVLFNHVLLLVHGGSGSTVRLANWVDKKMGWETNITIVGNRSACMLLGAFFAIVIGALFIYI
ncbi:MULTISPECIES: hypothetical protein [Pseudomonas]|uniref:Uncharacterized protein n=1 Tax=Pseudomonas mosselii TaxID=78327 RepID=A0ABX9B7H1_9PSED|nr:MULTISPECIES: hypothetical protein [Pseudomonas putida group]OAS08567.1 hypothetical protein AYO08_08315 [Pseudomonas putida]QZP28712.1 hypothetical protein K5H97_10345 [Pseudomonas mosselii]